MIGKTIILGTALLAGLSVTEAATDAKMKASALKFVPDSKVVKEDGHEFDLQTAKGTVVEVELNRDGTIDEASGNAAVGGDTLVPGNGLISLNDAVEALNKSGKKPVGDWSLEKSMINGWVYEFEGVENNKNREYTISAKDGKLLKDSRDVL